MSDSGRVYSVPVRPPYRLDLTATVLRRLSTNIVDVFDGRVYRRLIGAAAQPALVEVTQVAPDLLDVRVRGEPGTDVPALIGRMLGTQVELAHFDRVAAKIAWLAPIAAAARGVKSPRYPTLWEAIVNAVVYQQVSIHAAGAILRRVIERYAPVHAANGVSLAPFPTAQVFANADPLELRGLGLSVNKVVALRTLARAVDAGELDETVLEPLATPELLVALDAFKGIGPWTAAVVALRGFGRLDVFPLKDSGVARSLRELTGENEVDAAAILALLGPQRGMLYYHLLLGRLVARGEITFARG